MCRSDELSAIREVPPGTVRTFDDALASYLPQFREPLTACLDACIRDGTPFDLEAQLVTATQRVLLMRVMGSAQRAENGTVVWVVGAVQNIDDQRKVQEQLRHSQKMDSIGQLAGGIAHDFNNILSVILGYGSLVLDQLNEGDPLRADLFEIQRAGERAKKLTTQLLAFSRRQVLEPRVLALGHAVRSMEGMLRRLVPENIELALPSAGPLGKVFVDIGQMQQLVVNLVVNARDAMPNGGKLAIETADMELDAEYAALHHGVVPGPYVMLAVTDTGTGMDAATVARIFEPFFTTKEPGRGTGLGLSTVFGIVKQSHGHIWVYSELSNGSTFKVYFPRSDKPIARPATGITGSTTLVGTETILPPRRGRRTAQTRAQRHPEAPRLQRPRRAERRRGLPRLRAVRRQD